MIENVHTGEQVEFVEESPELLTMLTTWTRSGHRAAEHIHPKMEERFEVLEGRAAFRIDGVEIEAAVGSVVVAPPGGVISRGTRRTVVSVSGSGCVPLCGGASSPPASSVARTLSTSSPSMPTRSNCPWTIPSTRDGTEGVR